ncbi:hypothetical protein [Zavarzinella formosa]|uniref:hypothetical protein n=1 Tax=Zavarzinella formosa TaxID=360055 RepID=UPI0002FC233E|nr:hypothetical protein [Zavarzinella formosa]
MPSEKRVQAGKLNRRLRGKLTPDGRKTLRESALRHQPWKLSTGPKTIAGKARSAANGKTRQAGAMSVREMRAEVAEINSLIEEMRQTRRDL